MKNYFWEFGSQIADAIRELNAAQALYDKSSELYDGYEEKFKYNLNDIHYYVAKYGIDRRNISDNNKNNQIEKCWAAKAIAKDKGHPNLELANNIYVDINDDYSTKMNYTADKIWLYLQVFGIETKEKNTEQSTLYVEWSNVLSGKGHTKFFNDNSVQTNSSGDRKFSGNKTYNYDMNTIRIAVDYLKGASEKNITEEGLANLQKYVDSNDELRYSVEEDTDNSVNAAGSDAEAREGKEKEKVDKDIDTVFKLSENNGGEGADDFVGDADKFIEAGTTEWVKTDELQKFSQSLYGILFAVGVVIAVIMGMILGIKLMTSPIDQKAEAKKLLIPYVAGCVIVFGAFGIWKLVVTIMQQL